MYNVYASELDHPKVTPTSSRTSISTKVKKYIDIFMLHARIIMWKKFYVYICKSARYEYYVMFSKWKTKFSMPVKSSILSEKSWRPSKRIILWWNEHIIFFLIHKWFEQSLLSLAHTSSIIVSFFFFLLITNNM